MKRRNSPGMLVAVAALCAVAACGAHAGVFSDIMRHAPQQARSYQAVMDTVDALSGNPRITGEIIGQAHSGRAIPLVAVHDSGAGPDEDVPLLFIIARQHGTEVSGTEAALCLVEYFATTDNSTSLQILRQLTIVTVPAANPDGMVAGRRCNGAGRDLNRDWSALSQPETYAIADAVGRWHPQSLIDMHELPAHSSKPSYGQNFIETIGADGDRGSVSGQCRAVSLDLSQWMNSYGMRANMYYDHPGDSLKLCHRYFGLGMGIPAFLSEAKTGRAYPLDSRIAFHVLTALVVGNDLIHRYHIPAPSPDIRTVRQPETLEEPEQIAPPTLAFSYPGDGTVGSGLMPIEADVTGARRGYYVSFVVDGKLRAMTTTPPYSCSLNTERYENGAHTIGVQLCTPGGRSLLSRTRTVTFDNTAMPAR